MVLKRLYLENFALVDKIEINFELGLNVLTGETGAGKSIIVGAIARVLGDTASKEDIRSGFKMAAVEAEFDIAKRKDIAAELKSLEVESENNTLTLRREIFLEKASRCFLNGQMITLTQLRPIASLLGELHGQHSHQLLLDEKNHLGFLDGFAGLIEEVESLKQKNSEWEKAKKELEKSLNSRDLAKRERELLLFQMEEIDKAKIRLGEEEELLAEKKILDASRLLTEKSSLILGLLDENEPSAIEILGTAQKELSDMSEHDTRLTPLEEMLNQAVINLEELRSGLEAYRSDIPDDPNRQEEINLRLDEIFKLKKKYGGSEEGILATLDEIKRRLGDNIDVDEQIKFLKKNESAALAAYIQPAVEISKKRRDGAKGISQKVEKELAELGMEKAKFQFEFTINEADDGIEHNGKKVKPAPEGLEDGRFLVSANPGEPLKPLAKTASGGEISRIMLAIKAAERKGTKSEFLVFDEIDVGIGGMTAKAVAEKLAALAKKHQLLVVTHLHQIAQLGDYHYAVQKVSGTKEGRRIIEIKRLSNKEKEAEIKRMLALPSEV